MFGFAELYCMMAGACLILRQPFSDKAKARNCKSLLKVVMLDGDNVSVCVR